MAKRISTDAKIVLINAGYAVEYVYNDRGRVIALDVWYAKHICQLPVVAGCVDNSLIEKLLKDAE